jgi:hypothetical protein
MKMSRRAALLWVAVFCISLFAAGQTADKSAQSLNVTGKLTRVMAVGAETTGWAIELDEPMPIDGKPAKSIEISYPKTKKLERLEKEHVVATGTLTHRHGVETGDRPVLEVSYLKKSVNATAAH